MGVFEIKVDDQSMAAAAAYAQERKLPMEGVVVLALVDIVKDRPDSTVVLKPANERLLEIAAAVESMSLYVPPRLEDAKALAEQLRYLAQFTSTDAVPPFDGKD